LILIGSLRVRKRLNRFLLQKEKENLATEVTELTEKEFLQKNEYVERIIE